jgi:hypothetical protein
VTTYIVLKQTDEGTWREVGEVGAHSADKAIRRVIDPDGIYVVVTTAGWRERSSSKDDEEAARIAEWARS